MFFANEKIEIYSLLEPLGTSGMCEVWLAEDTANGRQVALKLPFDPEYIRHLRKEGKLEPAPKHPVFAGIQRLEAAHEPPFIVMEYVEGQNLREYIRARGILPLQTAMRILAPVMEGLAEAHRHGMLHRDLKPENILIAKDGTVKITGFGLGKVMEDLAQSLLAMDNLNQAFGPLIAGLYSYMAPEQRQGAEVKPSADVYATGLILFEMLTGSHATDNISRSLKRHSVPEPVIACILRATAASTLERFQNESIFQAVLDEALKQALKQPGVNVVPGGASAKGVQGEPILEADEAPPMSAPDELDLQLAQDISDFTLHPASSEPSKSPAPREEAVPQDKEEAIGELTGAAIVGDDDWALSELTARLNSRQTPASLDSSLTPAQQDVKQEPAWPDLDETPSWQELNEVEMRQDSSQPPKPRDSSHAETRHGSDRAPRDKIREAAVIIHKPGWRRWAAEHWKFLLTASALILVLVAVIGALNSAASWFSFNTAILSFQRKTPEELKAAAPAAGAKPGAPVLNAKPTPAANTAPANTAPANAAAANATAGAPATNAPANAPGAAPANANAGAPSPGTEPPLVSFVFIAEPPEAAAIVKLDGQEAGLTPLLLRLPQNKSCDVQIEAPGYAAWTARLIPSGATPGAPDEIKVNLAP
ncbi:MAG: serine/threonine-protein kinase [Candidatus Sumerlaeota bacterium]|nr:serine/threonine-protein kinase [Candidatus Sumerlaeota bacterium]